MLYILIFMLIFTVTYFMCSFLHWHNFSNDSSFIRWLFISNENAMVSWVISAAVICVMLLVFLL